MNADVSLEPGLVADYGLLLSEAAHVLTAIVDSPREDRDEELEVLREIYAEAPIHPSDEDSLEGHICSMFCHVMELGEILTPTSDTSASRAVHTIEHLTHALALALDGRSPETQVAAMVQDACELGASPDQVEGSLPDRLLIAARTADREIGELTHSLHAA